MEFAVDGGDEDDVEQLMAGSVGLAKRISTSLDSGAADRDERGRRRALRISADKSAWKT